MVNYPGVVTSLDTLTESDFLRTQKSLEDIKNILFREVYLDILVDIRELRSKISVIKDTPIEEIGSVEETLICLEKLRRDLGSIPLPTDLHHRKDQVERASREMKDLLL